MNFRDGQNYWITPSFKVQAIAGGLDNMGTNIVCKFPEYLQNDVNLVYNVCHAVDDDRVNFLIKNRLENLTDEEKDGMLAGWFTTMPKELRSHYEKRIKEYKMS